MSPWDCPRAAVTALVRAARAVREAANELSLSLIHI